ncbi:MAG: UbiA prenyltransferase family protein [Polyangiaceae bacterium]|nr:UbiA prenyltransferase family protein [Polyangiaceae bacterium]
MIRLARDLWRLSRPEGTFWLIWVVLIGYGFMLWDWGVGPRGEWDLGLLVVGWWCLSTGSLWLNAGLDRDQGEVLFQRDATRVPRGVERFGYGALALGVAITACTTWGAAVCALFSALLAVLYSHPKARWKAHSVGGPLVNLVGYGLLTPLAGALVTGLPLTWRAGLSGALVASWILGAYFIAQVFQEREDAARGYRTRVVTHGPLGALKAGRALMAVSWVGITLGMVVGLYPRLCLLALPLLLLTDHFLARWGRALREGRGADWGRSAALGLHRRMMVSGAVLFWLAYCDYLADYRAERPAAGWATARGRPKLPLWALEPMDSVLH